MSSWSIDKTPAAAPVRPDAPARPARPPEPIEDAESPVRPYTVVAGRTRVPDSLALSVESLVHGIEGPTSGLSPEARRVLDLTIAHYQSVAELSARLRLPLGVVRVLVADLAGSGRVTVHGSLPDPARTAGQPLLADRRLLESVLDGIASL